jgi:hypothetical protein
MKVLKPGRPQAGWSKEFKCTGGGNGGGGCGAKLLVSEYDLYQTESHHYDGSSDYYMTFCCEQCGVETDINDHSAELKGKRPSEKERKARGLKNRERSE